MDAQTLWIFVHLVLAVYWLGPDWGVYVASAYVCRAESPPTERMRFMQAIVAMAQVSRNALILLLPVGLTLADGLGVSMLSGPWLAVSWALGLAWLCVSIWMYRRRGSEIARALNRLDLAARYILIVVLSAAAVSSMVMHAPFSEAWLSLKVLLYAFLLVNSIQQRAVALAWVGAVTAMNATGPTTALQAAIAAVYPRSRVNAYLTWAASFAIVFLGVAKPF